MKLVYICSPLKGDIKDNIRRANQYCCFAAREAVLPLAPHTIFTQYLDDNKAEERNTGLHLGMELLKRCDELWCFGEKMSEGMKAEIRLAETLKIPVIYFNNRCERLVDS